jgi:anaerobic magnesium-protoporphyrin IX monomethyl ester cyclase
MRIALLYPPPWLVPEPGSAQPDAGDGPPSEYREGDLDGDFFQIPYGLLTLGATALEAGHRVKLLNLSAFTGPRVDNVVRALEADIFGISCFTANRRGTAMVARMIREAHPNACVVVGGPHATALPAELLAHVSPIDAVVVGEGEATLLELVDRVARGQDLAGLAGAFYRRRGQIERGPTRAPLSDLDALPNPHRYFASHLLLTARGCPWRCTFCAAKVQWGRKLRLYSADYVLASIEEALGKLPVRMLSVKDDTFTASRRRTLDLLRAIRTRDIQFVWSCDTRADALDEEIVRELRLAGCQRVSLGVESGSPTILRNIHKRTSPEAVLRATELCKQVGLQVRYFMMLGNRGETAQTLQESLDFVERAQPHQVLFACLSIYPGTSDYQELVGRGWLDPETYFVDDFQELKFPFDASPEDTRMMSEWFARHRGLREIYREGIAEYRSVLERTGEHWGPELDLGGAYYRAGDLGPASEHVGRALALGHPAPGLCHNYLGCMRARERDWDGMWREFELASEDPQHWVIVRNQRALAAWQASGGPSSGGEPELVARHDFELFERPVQPNLPGPLPADFAEWD